MAEQHTITDSKVLSILDKVDLVRNNLNGVLINRKEIIDLSIIAVISQENIVLLGPPGTGKSMLANELCKRIEGANIFQRLLTKFTDETELFVSGQSLSEEDIEIEVTKKKTVKNAPVTKKKITKIEKYTNGMLPDHDIAFLDEIFKANSAILNALLTLINEKIYFSSDGKKIQSDLITVFGASNERPDPNSGLEALYDRFLIRYYIDYLDGDDFIELLKLKENVQLDLPKITKDNLKYLNAFLTNIQISEDIYKRIGAIRTDIKTKANSDSKFKTIRPSDRRMKNSLKLLKARALLQRRNNVTNEDVTAIFPFILWDTTPGTSSNLSKQTLQDLINMLTKETTVAIKKFYAYLDEINKLGKEVQVLEKNAENAIRDNNRGKKEIVLQYIDKATRISSQIETYIKEAEHTKSEANLEDYEKTWLVSFIKDFKELEEKYTKEMSEINKKLRPSTEVGG